MDKPLIIDCRRLPSIGNAPPRMQLSGEGIEAWEDTIPPQIEKILNGRWSCKLLIRTSGGNAEVVGEAPPEEEDASIAEDAPPTLKFPGT